MSNVTALCIPVSELSAECVPGYESSISFGELALVLLLLCFSALFSGLNLGLMSLDSVELEVSSHAPYTERQLTFRVHCPQIVAGSGNAQDAKYAKALMPIRQVLESMAGS